MDKKRILAIAIFILFCGIFGFLLYTLFFSSSKTNTRENIQNTNGTAGKFPTTNEREIEKNFPISGEKTNTSGGIDSEEFFIATEFPTIRQLVTDPIVGANVDQQGNIKYYNEVDGKFYEINSKGTAIPLTDDLFYNVENVTWSPNTEESIIEYPDGANIYYNFETKKQVTLPKHWEDFSFSKGSNKIAAKSLALAEENRWVIVSNPDGSEIELIESLGNNADKVSIEWSPNNQIIGLAKTGEAQGAERQDIHLVGLHGENFRSLSVEGRGFESSWSPEGKKLLYSVYSPRNNFNPELWIANAEGTTVGTGRKNLGLSTWSHKCTFSNEQTIYCAVPSNLPKGTGFAPDIVNTTPDLFYKIDLSSGLKTQIDVEDAHVVESMFISKDGKTLHFTDKTQTGLFSLPL